MAMTMMMGKEKAENNFFFKDSGGGPVLSSSSVPPNAIVKTTPLLLKAWNRYMFRSFFFQVMDIESSLSGAMLRTVVGEVCLIPSHSHISNFYLFIQPTGTSTKFANMTEQALQQFKDKYGLKFDKITKILLEGDGTIDKRVEWYAPGLAP